MTGLNKWTVLKVDAKLSVKMPMVPSRNVRLPTSKWTVIISGVNGFRSKWAFIKLKNGQVVFLGSFWPSGLFNLCSKDHPVLSDSTVQFQSSRTWTPGSPTVPNLSHDSSILINPVSFFLKSRDLPLIMSPVSYVSYMLNVHGKIYLSMWDLSLSTF